jgi:hypothetical protein
MVAHLFSIGRIRLAPFLSAGRDKMYQHAGARGKRTYPIRRIGLVWEKDLSHPPDRISLGRISPYPIRRIGSCSRSEKS